MNRWTIAILILVAGCATLREPQFAQNEIKVPKVFRQGVGWGGAPGDYERYLESYSRGYWSCIENYRTNINYVSTRSDYIASGWYSEICGFSAGYEAAEKDIHRNISTFGKEKTHQFIVEWWEGY